MLKCAICFVPSDKVEVEKFWNNYDIAALYGFGALRRKQDLIFEW